MMIEYLQVSLAMFSTLVFVKRPLVQNCKEKELGISLMHETHRVSGQRKHQDIYDNIMAYKVLCYGKKVVDFMDVVGMVQFRH